MNSPFTGGTAILQEETSVLTFRKEVFSYTKLCFRCEDTDECYTTSELDEINVGQVYNRYRVKYGIPFPDEISSIRAKHGLSAVKMSEILGFGENQYRLYENGEMPSQANGKTLRSIMNPAVFARMVHDSKHQFPTEEYSKIMSKVEKSALANDTNSIELQIFVNYERSLLNGYAAQSYSKLTNILLYFIEKMDGVFCTKMNKLLFYLDFLSYKRYGVGVSGLAYNAIQYGPVPVRWDRVYSMIDEIDKEIHEWEDGKTGEKLVSIILPNIKSFSDRQLSLLNEVMERFKDVSSNAISHLSHNENAWINYIHKKEMIDYSEAFSLKAI